VYGYSKQRWRCACASSLCTVRRCQLCSCCCPCAILSSSVERSAEP
jgi:hypothetical protein